VLDHAVLAEYVPFITLLFSLYVIAGGIVVRGDIRATPAVNTSIIGVGGLLASFIGTTGSAMLLIRFLLRTNSERKHKVHTVVFFIFIAANVGGTLLPIGDPPLFLGYLRGVDFFWTLGLWKYWAFMLAILLGIYFLWDSRAYEREAPQDIRLDDTQFQPMQVVGLVNVLWLLGVVSAVATLDPSKAFPGTTWHAPPYLREGVQRLIGVHVECCVSFFRQYVGVLNMFVRELPTHSFPSIYFDVPFRPSDFRINLTRSAYSVTARTRSLSRHQSRTGPGCNHPSSGACRRIVPGRSSSGRRH